MRNFLDAQQRVIQLNASYRMILKKMMRLSNDDVEKIIRNSDQNFLKYGKSFDEMVHFLGLDAFYDDAKTITDICMQYDQNHDFNHIGVTALDLVTAMDEIADVIALYENMNPRKCCLCHNELFYFPISSYYERLRKKYDVKDHVSETLNRNEYSCPLCCSTDRDRLIVSFLEKFKLDEKNINEKMLQIAPSKAIEHWVHSTTTSVIYETTDLFMDEVTFRSDIQNMEMVQDNTYDYIICSHVLEHVENDKKAMAELYRIVKEDGVVAFLVSIRLDVEEIDEEWGLSEEENWRRFGQNDHCRVYSKKGLVERLEETGFCVHQLGIDYFGEDTFAECGLTETSVLYVLTKQRDSIDTIIQKKLAKRRQRKDSPLVSVIMSAYNHEKYVARAIESVLNQTYQNIEFLIADDCSTDRTAEILRKYEGRVKKIYYADKNTGSQLRFLLAKTTGKYVALINSDDYWFPEKIEKQIDYILSHPECGACFTGAACIDENEQQTIGPFRKENKSKENWMNFFFKHCNCLCHPSVLIERDLYSKLLHGVGVRIYRQLGDFMMWLQLIQEREIHVVEQDLVRFTVHGKGDNKNMSAGTKRNNIILSNEIGHIWYHIIKNMKFDYFVESFRKDMIYKDISTENELKCEKLIVLLHSPYPTVRNSALYFLYDVYNSELLELFEKKYGLSLRELQQLGATILINKIDLKDE